jgi:hypothetical protein
MLTFLVALIAPTAAWAQEPGVHSDPDSPAGKEYALPLDSVRRDTGGGGSGGGNGGGGGSDLFGAGIVRAGGGSADTGSSGSGGSSRDDGGRRQGDGGSATENGRGERGSSGSTALASSSDDSATFKSGLVALAVLVAGAGLGLLLRRGLRN